MGEERPTERSLEEVVFDRVVRVIFAMQVSVDRKRRGVVDAHGQTHRVAARDVSVLGAAIELVLLVVEAVDDVARTTAWCRRSECRVHVALRPAVTARAGEGGERVR